LDDGRNLLEVRNILHLKNLDPQNRAESMMKADSREQILRLYLGQVLAQSILQFRDVDALHSWFLVSTIIATNKKAIIAMFAAFSEFGVRSAECVSESGLIGLRSYKSEVRRYRRHARIYR